MDLVTVELIIIQYGKIYHWKLDEPGLWGALVVEHLPIMIEAQDPIPSTETKQNNRQANKQTRMEEQKSFY